MRITQQAFPPCIASPSQLTYVGGQLSAVNTFRNCLSHVADPMLIPSIQNGTLLDSVNVTAALVMNNLHTINAVAGTVEMDFYLRLWWFDDRLSMPLFWNETDEAARGAGIELTNIGSDSAGKLFWAPDFFFLDNIDSTKLAETVRLHANNEIFWSRHFIMTFEQALFDFRDYPFDEQDIAVRFGSYAHNQSFVRISLEDHANGPQTESLPAVSYIENIDGSVSFIDDDLWDVFPQNVQYRTYPVDIVAGTTEFALFIFPVQRASNGIVVRLVVPMTLLLMIGAATFWLGDPLPRVSIATTAMLSVMALYTSVASQVPLLRYSTRIDQFIFAMNAILVGVILLHVLSTLLHRHVTVAAVYDLDGVELPDASITQREAYRPGMVVVLKSIKAFGRMAVLPLVLLLSITLMFRENLYLSASFSLVLALAVAAIWPWELRKIWRDLAQHYHPAAVSEREVEAAAHRIQKRFRGAAAAAKRRVAAGVQEAMKWHALAMDEQRRRIEQRAYAQPPSVPAVPSACAAKDDKGAGLIERGNMSASEWVRRENAALDRAAVRFQAAVIAAGERINAQVIDPVSAEVDAALKRARATLLEAAKERSGREYDLAIEKQVQVHAVERVYEWVSWVRGGARGRGSKAAGGKIVLTAPAYEEAIVTAANQAMLIIHQVGLMLSANPQNQQQQQGLEMDVHQDQSGRAGMGGVEGHALLFTESGRVDSGFGVGMMPWSTDDKSPALPLTPKNASSGAGTGTEVGGVGSIEGSALSPSAGPKLYTVEQYVEKLVSACLAPSLSEVRAHNWKALENVFETRVVLKLTRATTLALREFVPAVDRGIKVVYETAAALPTHFDAAYASLNYPQQVAQGVAQDVAYFFARKKLYSVVVQALQSEAGLRSALAEYVNTTTGARAAILRQTMLYYQAGEASSTRLTVGGYGEVQKKTGAGQEEAEAEAAVDVALWEDLEEIMDEVANMVRTASKTALYPISAITNTNKTAAAVAATHTGDIGPRVAGKGVGEGVLGGANSLSESFMLVLPAELNTGPDSARSKELESVEGASPVLATLGGSASSRAVRSAVRDAGAGVGGLSGVAGGTGMAEGFEEGQGTKSRGFSMSSSGSGSAQVALSHDLGAAIGGGGESGRVGVGVRTSVYDFETVHSPVMQLREFPALYSSPAESSNQLLHDAIRAKHVNWPVSSQKQKYMHAPSPGYEQSKGSHHQRHRTCSSAGSASTTALRSRRITVGSIAESLRGGTFSSRYSAGGFLRQRGRRSSSSAQNSSVEGSAHGGWQSGPDVMYISTIVAQELQEVVQEALGRADVLAYVYALLPEILRYPSVVSWFLNRCVGVELTAQKELFAELKASLEFREMVEAVVDDGKSGKGGRGGGVRGHVRGTCLGILQHCATLESVQFGIANAAYSRMLQGLEGGSHQPQAQQQHGGEGQRTEQKTGDKEQTAEGLGFVGQGPGRRARLESITEGHVYEGGAAEEEEDEEDDDEEDGGDGERVEKETE